jgi:hypothetical protein
LVQNTEPNAEIILLDHIKQTSFRHLHVGLGDNLIEVVNDTSRENAIILHVEPHDCRSNYLTHVMP